MQRGPDGARSPEVGHLTPQYRVTHQGSTALLDELTGGGFTVLTDGDAPLAALDAADRGFLTDIGATLVPLHADHARAEGYLDADDAPTHREAMSGLRIFPTAGVSSGGVQAEFDF